VKLFIIVEQTTMFQTKKRMYRTKFTAFTLHCNEDILLRQKHIILFSLVFFLRNHFYFVDLYLLFIITLCQLCADISDA
jgi:hypothetical protein